MEVKKRVTGEAGRIATPGPQPNVHKSSIPVKASSSSTKSPKCPSSWTPNSWRVFSVIVSLAFAIRLYRLGKPDQVVFDEVHFGGFASHYLKREYFFDVHPPLGKMIIALAGYVAGFDGSFRFEKIGLEYASGSAPYRFIRLMMILFGTGAIGFSLASLVEMGTSPVAVGLAGVLMAFDNALTVQTKFVLLDSMLMFFIFASIYNWIKFRQQRYQPFSLEWWGYLVATGAAISCATGVKMVGLFTVGTVGVATMIDLWDLADHRRHYSDGLLLKHFAARALGLIAVPICLYLSFFYMHFSILSKTGPGDGFMSPEFQSTLEGNGMHLNSRTVYYGQQVKIKNKVEDIWLHSHTHSYPLHHDDGKVSSQGQQVTGYVDSDEVPDVNNIWVFMPATSEQPIGRQPIKNGDTVRLYHPATKKYLLTHDVASPLTMTNQEVTMYDWSEEKRQKDMMWTVQITQNTAGGGQGIKSMSTIFKLVHVPTKVHLNNHQLPLPKWGFGQREINGCKRGHKEASKWSVSSIMDDMDEEERKQVEERAKSKVEMSFLQKFFELQGTMLSSNAKLSDDHPFKSTAGQWPLVTRGIAFWDQSKQARIYLLGNPVAWYAALIGTCFLIGTLAKELYLWRRGLNCNIRYAKRGGFILLAYALHYLPFFTMTRSLYLHHYLPSFMLTCMGSGVVYDYLIGRGGLVLKYSVGAIIAASTVITFVYFSPITYGLTVPTDVLNSKKWVSTWDWP